MKRGSILIVVSVLLLLAGAAGGYTAVRSTGHAHRLDIKAGSLGNPGVQIPLGPAAAAMLSHFDSVQANQLGPTYALAERGDRQLYRIATSRSYSCYAAGPATAERVEVFSIVACPIDPTFPSDGRPVMDFSVLTRAIGASSHYTRIEGLASDGITAIGLLDASGALIAKVSVTDNVYEYVPSDSSVTGIVAFDAAGNSVPIH